MSFKILAISHSCVTDVNQQLYISLSRIPSVQVVLVTPLNWKSEYTGKPLVPSLLPGVTFPVHRIPVGVPGHNSLHFYRRGLGKAIRDARPNVVFLDEEPWSLAAFQVVKICQRLKIPLVFYTKQNIEKRYPAPFAWIEQDSYRTASAIIALSEEVQAVLRRKGFAGPCPLLAHACDLALFSPDRATELRETLRLSPVVAGFMGRFVPEKGLETFVQALKLLAAAQPALKFSALFVGSGPEEDALKASASAAGVHAVFAGSVPHLEAGRYMNCMDIFVLPSRTTPTWKEQFGRVIIEAMACGVPVVGSDSGQIPILIRETGGGLVFQEGDAEDLAEKLSCLVGDPETRARLGRTGQEAVQRSYTYDAVAAQLYSILHAAVKTPL